MVSRAAYFLLFCLTSFVALIMDQYAYDIMSWIPVIQQCDKETCYGNIAVFRITFALVLFHSILGLILIGVRNSKDFRSAVQDGFWGLKFLIVAIITVLCFLIPNAFFHYWVWFSLAGAAIFLVIQLILLIDFAHSWSESWVAKMEASEDPRGWYAALVGSTFVMYSIAFSLIVLLYNFFSDNHECWINSFFTTIVFISSIVFTVVSVHPRIVEANPRSGLLQSSVITFYAVYVVWSAIMSEPSDEEYNCNPWKSSQAQQTSSLIIGAFFSIISVCYSTMRAATKHDDLVGYKTEGAKQLLVGEESSEAQSLENGTSIQARDDHDDDNTDHDDEREGTAYNYSFFHLVFAMGYCYIAELLVDWATLDANGDSLHNVDSGWPAVWVKIVTSWLVILLYVWTLIAPLLLPDRDFS